MEEEIDRYGDFSPGEEAIWLEEGHGTEREEFILPGHPRKGFVPDFLRNIGVRLWHVFAEVKGPCQHFEKLSSVHTQGRFEENALGREAFHNSFCCRREDERGIPLTLGNIVKPSFTCDMGDRNAPGEDEHFC